MRIRIRQLFFCCLCALNLCAIAQPTTDIRGVVQCQGEGISNVVVTNGFDCVLTDVKGAYSLPYNRDARFV